MTYQSTQSPVERRHTYAHDSRETLSSNDKARQIQEDELLLSDLQHRAGWENETRSDRRQEDKTR